MELKAKEDMYEVNYLTQEESKMSLWKLIMSNKKINISILCVFLLINEAMATQFDYINNPPIEVGGIETISTPIQSISALVVRGLCIIVITVIIMKAGKCIMKKISDKKVDKNE